MVFQVQVHPSACTKWHPWGFAMGWGPCFVTQSRRCGPTRRRHRQAPLCFFSVYFCVVLRFVHNGLIPRMYTACTLQNDPCDVAHGFSRAGGAYL